MTMKVRLHSNNEQAANATDNTIKSIPGAFASLARGQDGKIVFDDSGLATVITGSPDFLAFVLRNQGYVSEVYDHEN